MSKVKLMKARKWAEQHFTPESMPNQRCLRNWVVEGTVKGELIGPGQQAYVYEDQVPGTISKAHSIALELAANS